MKIGFTFSTPLRSGLPDGRVSRAIARCQSTRFEEAPTASSRAEYFALEFRVRISLFGVPSPGRQELALLSRRTRSLHRGMTEYELFRARSNTNSAGYTGCSERRPP
jgi:hypothetical protein